MNIKLIDSKKPPVILFTDKSVRKMNYVIDKVNTEVGWLGTVEKSIKMDKDNDWVSIYKITDIFVPKQFVAAATCEIKEEGRHELTKNLLEKYGDDLGMQMASSLLFWGHSHVNMGTSPSAQDNSMVMDFKTRDYFIRGIFNKKGQITLDFYDFQKGIQWTDLKPTYETPELTEDELNELNDAIEHNLNKERERKKEYPLVPGTLGFPYTQRKFSNYGDYYTNNYLDNI